jgi:hypothetical protein
MFGHIAAYVVAISTLMCCGISALTLINTVRHFDPPEARDLPEQIRHKGAA